MNDTRVERFRRALEVPLLRFLRVTALDERDPAAGLSFVVGPDSLNAANALHGGALATVLDVAAFAALLAELDDTEQATTHAFSASYLAGAQAGDRAEAHATVLRRTASLAFVTAEVMADSGLLATALVTKSIRRR